jgi:hypothetical protein
VALALHIGVAMQIKSLLVTLGLLGSSTLALASHRTTWQPLSSQQRLDRGGDRFDLRTRERFSQLRLQNQTGRTLVRQIDIVFADGSRQCVEVNRVLDGNHAMINVDLDGDARRIDKIFIDGRSSRFGSYQLYAM